MYAGNPTCGHRAARVAPAAQPAERVAHAVALRHAGAVLEGAHLLEAPLPAPANRVGALGVLQGQGLADGLAASCVSQSVNIAGFLDWIAAGEGLA